MDMAPCNESISRPGLRMLWRLIISFMVLSLDGAMKECGAATLTLRNECGYRVWPGVLSNAGSPLLGNGGFRLEAGQSAALEAPDGWSGRLWGRTGCSFATDGTSGRCVTGDCAGRLQCAGAGAETPATLAEFTLASASGGNGNDFYDVSLVDGYNLPIAIIPAGIGISSAASSAATRCAAAGCAADLNRNCPAALQVLSSAAAASAASSEVEAVSIDREDPVDVVVGCKSACDAFGDPKFCCSGAYSNPSTCSPSSYAQIFKSACPAAYSYAFDDPTSTFTCTSGTHYSIVFCPSSTTSSSQKSASGQSSLVGTKAYASEMSTSPPSTSAAPAHLLLHLAVHVVLLLALARRC